MLSNYPGERVRSMVSTLGQSSGAWIIPGYTTLIVANHTSMPQTAQLWTQCEV